MFVLNSSGSNFVCSVLIKFDVDASYLQNDYFVLRLFVRDVIAHTTDTDATRTVTISRLAETFDAMAITYRTMDDATVVAMGPSFVVTSEKKYTWLEIGVTDLVKTPSPDDSHLVFGLECLSSGVDEGFIMFGISEQGFVPQLVRADGTTAKVLAHQDIFVRYNTYKEMQFGLNKIIMIKNDNNAKYDRKGLVQLDLSGYDLSSSTSAVVRLHVKAIGTNTFCTITVSKLNDPDLDLHLVSWSTLDISRATVGKDVSIHKDMVGRWIDFVVTDLVQSSAPIVFLLEKKGPPQDKGYVKFETLQSDVELAPQLILDTLDSISN